MILWCIFFFYMFAVANKKYVDLKTGDCVLHDKTTMNAKIILFTSTYNVQNTF